MGNNRIEQLIRTFFSQHFSQGTRSRFAWWMVNSGDEQSDKDSAMQQLWEEQMDDMDLQTLADLQKLHGRMAQPQAGGQSPAIRPHIGSRQRYWAAAAAVVLVALTALSTYLITSGHASSTTEGYAQVSAPYGENMEIWLEDSTHVMLNAGTTLLYPRHFEKDRRNVFLLGEANFSVRHDKKRPFTVETQGINVTALGTKFEVSAYPDTRTVSTTLEEGRTRVEITAREGTSSGKRYILEPNQNLALDRTTGEVQISAVDARKRLSWETGNLIFEGENFQEIIHCLERKYSVSIYCEHMERMTGSYFAKFRADESIQDALDILRDLSHSFDYRIEGDSIYIFPK